MTENSPNYPWSSSNIQTTIADIAGLANIAAQQIESSGVKALALRCELNREEEIDHTIKEVLKTFGSIDILAWIPIQYEKPNGFSVQNG